MEHSVKRERDPVLGRVRFKKKNDDYIEYNYLGIMLELSWTLLDT